MFKKFAPLIPLVAVAVLAISHFTSVAAADNEKEAGFTSLFNGKNLAGLVIESGGKFSVRDGLLVLSQGSGWLRSEKEYGDFILKMDFRFLEKNANSGIFFRTRGTSVKDEFGWPDYGYQVQCMDIIVGPRPCGSLLPYGAPPFTSETDMGKLIKTYHPTGQWNSYEIKCVGQELSVKLNGVLVTTAKGIKNLRGHVGIQGEFGNLHFRNLRIKEIQ